MPISRRTALHAALAVACGACGAGSPRGAAANGVHDAARSDADPTRNPAARPLAITDATILTATGQRLEHATLVLDGGAIRALGPSRQVPVPPGAQVVDGRGTVVTPGLIEAHSHVGLRATLAAEGTDDANELALAATGALDVAHAYWPQDPAIARTRAAGVTTALILPGSWNVIGGRGLVVAMRPGRTVDEVRFAGAPSPLKLSCGEGPTHARPGRGAPTTRMAAHAELRAAFAAARAHRAEHGDRPPSSMIEREHAALIAALEGRAPIHVHCYRADDLAQLLAIADEAGVELRAFHHATDAYKLRELLAARGVAVATWADFFAPRVEMADAIPENAALVTEAGGRAIIHGDAATVSLRLNQEAAKAMFAGRAAGVAISEDQALRWITANPAWALGVDRWVGTLEVGKRADVVVWSGDPFSVYTRPAVVIQAGEIVHRAGDAVPPVDLEVGR